jgi:DNA polymerase-3 subunit beta
MKFTINPKTLKEELSFLTNVIDDKKGSIPILANVLIETVSDETIRITGTNLGTSIQTEVEADIDELGTMCINGVKLYNMVKVLEADITFQDEKNNWVRIKSGTSKYRMPGIDAKRYPEVFILDKVKASVDSLDLAKMVKATKFAINLEETRYALAGVKFIVGDKVAKMVSTDGHRVSYMETEGSGEIDTLLPVGCLSELIKLPKGLVNIGENENLIFFQAGHKYLTTKKLAGNFPRYEAMFNEDGNEEFVVETEAFKKAVQRVSLMSDLGNKAIRFEITQDKLVLSTNTSDAGESEDEVEIEYKGKDRKIALNWFYIMQFLNNYENEQLHISLESEKKPVLLGYGSDEYKYILMPMTF